MKRLTQIIGAGILFGIVFWIGFLYSFPGAAFSEFIEGRLAAATGQTVDMQPAVMRWNGITIPQVRFRVGASAADTPPIVLNDLTVPFGPALLSGIPLHATIASQGSLYLYWPWGDGQVEFAVEGIALESIPAVRSIVKYPLKGTLRLNGELQREAGKPLAAKGRLPGGFINGEITGLTIEGFEILTKPLPAVKLNVIRFELALGERVEIQTLSFDGDLKGKLEGTIQPNLKAPGKSRLQLTVTAAFRDKWLDGLGEFRPIAETYLDNGQFKARLGGTLNRPQFRASGRRS